MQIKSCFLAPVNMTMHREISVEVRGAVFGTGNDSAPTYTLDERKLKCLYPENKTVLNFGINLLIVLPAQRTFKEAS